MDEKALAAALRGCLIDHLGTENVVLVVDETGDVKKGTHTVGLPANTRAPRGRWRTAKWRSTSPKPHPAPTR